MPLVASLGMIWYSTEAEVYTLTYPALSSCMALRMLSLDLMELECRAQ